jgi:hypothetical protein
MNDFWFTKHIIFLGVHFLWPGEVKIDAVKGIPKFKLKVSEFTGVDWTKLEGNLF